ncbi:hypothetical protein [Alicyclobacillus fructus]|uniref:hypothetical protein n=1 Tax=Alicyclobacillus fructus TaxID=2816082 RepID=UPI001A9052D0|nr:hypothetical protein [Alicyclobacillus fructus]
MPALLVSLTILGHLLTNGPTVSASARQAVYGPTVHTIRLDTAHHVVTVDLRPVAGPPGSAPLEATDGRGITPPTAGEAYTDGRAITAPVSPRAYTDGRDTGRGAKSNRGSLVLSVPLGWELDVEGVDANRCEVRTADLETAVFQPVPGHADGLHRRFLLGHVGTFRLVMTDSGQVAKVLDTLVVSSQLQDPVIGAP